MQGTDVAGDVIVSTQNAGAADHQGASSVEEDGHLSRVAEIRVVAVGDDGVQGSMVDFGAVALRCRRGLTSSARPTCWKLMMGFYPTKQTRWSDVEAAALSRYVDIVQAVRANDAATGVPALGSLQAIDMDVPRTMFRLDFFSGEASARRESTAGAISDSTAGEADVREGEQTSWWWHVCGATRHGDDEEKGRLSAAQESLRRVLYTLASVNKGLGYVQGMNELAGHLLYAFAQGQPALLTHSVEADAFFCLQTLLGYLGDNFCRALDHDSQTGMSSMLRHFDHVLDFFDEPLARHLQQIGIISAHYALRWMTLLFTQELAVEEVLRVWDFILSFGDALPTVTVLVAVAMCHCRRTTLLPLAALEEVMPSLLNYPAGCVGQVLQTVRYWLKHFDLAFVQSLKTVTAEHVVELRQTYLRSRVDGTSCNNGGGGNRDDDDGRNPSLSAIRDTVASTLRGWWASTA